MGERRLRGVLLEISTIVGDDLAWRLAERFGGREIHVPSPDRIEPGHPLAMILGLDQAMRFAAVYEGPRFLVPIGRPGRTRQALAAERRATVQRLLAEGRSAREVVEAAGIHLRTVFRYRQRAKNGNSAAPAEAETQRTTTMPTPPP